MAKVDLLGVGIDPVTQDDLIARLAGEQPGAARLLVAHANITGLNLAATRPWMRRFYNECAGVVYADGMGVLLGARWLGERIPQRYTLADWVWPLMRACAAAERSVYLLGGQAGVAAQAGAVLQAGIPNLRVAGTRHGFFDKTPGCAENDMMLQSINASGAHLLMVGFGMPAQEAWLMENWTALDTPTGITVGALFEYLSGDLRRGPAWMTDHYLEWLARLLISPRRYARRYLRDVPLFAWRIFKQGRAKRKR